jgi:hypothetical protein
MNLTLRLLDYLAAEIVRDFVIAQRIYAIILLVSSFKFATSVASLPVFWAGQAVSSFERSFSGYEARPSFEGFQKTV